VSFLKNVDQRTSLAGMNRMELLLFTIKGEQLFGINVFKVREVIRTPEISSVPKSDSRIMGVADIRGQTMPLIDLAKALDMPPIEKDNYRNSLTIVTEFNSSIQGFLVEDVERIVHLRWEDILPPPDTLQNVNFLTGITRAQEQIVEILDIEKVLVDVTGHKAELQNEIMSISGKQKQLMNNYFVLAADDSSVARSQLETMLNKLGVRSKIVKNGSEALVFLKHLVEKHDTKAIDRVLMVISDIEMPKMDGYTLTTHIREDDRLKGLFVVLNSSLSGGFNDSLTAKVGADRFISKWHIDELAEIVLERIKVIEDQIVEVANG
jgi:two-component system chemotaxis response regulator CheV